MDASALVRGLSSVEGDATAGEWLDAAVRGRVRALVPDLVFAEVANAFALQARMRRLAPEDAEDAVRTALELPLRSLSLRSLALEALALAISRDVSVYDACYLALAEAREAVLVTADRRLAEAATKSVLLPAP